MPLGILIAAWSLAKNVSGLTPILTFHDVISNRDESSLWFDCSTSELETQIRWFKAKGAHFVTLKQIYLHLAAGKPLPSKSIAITFADGYEGFYKFGVPILRREKVPVTMFVHTDYVGDQHGHPKMTWPQLKELDREGLVEICSQTRTHPADLRTLSADSLRSEMIGSKQVLEQNLGHAVPFLAYPNGKFDLRVAKSARDSGYLAAFTEQLTPSERSPNLFMISRYVHTRYRQAWRDAGRR